jgi:signal peptidase
MKQTKPIDLESMNYIGPSMNPILKAGDRLEIVSCKGQKFRPGDVIVFIPPGGDSKVIHRVVDMDSQGIRTRGDNCTDIDPWILKPEQVLGRVVCARRRNKRLRVFGGPMGRLAATVVRAINWIDSSVSELLRPPYKRLARIGFFKQLIPERVEPQVVSFSRPSGTELQLLIGRWVIGRWLAGKSGWNIRRPFRLFVDENSLPENPSKLGS